MADLLTAEHKELLKVFIGVCYLNCLFVFLFFCWFLLVLMVLLMLMINVVI